MRAGSWARKVKSDFSTMRSWISLADRGMPLRAPVSAGASERAARWLAGRAQPAREVAADVLPSRGLERDPAAQHHEIERVGMEHELHGVRLHARDVVEKRRADLAEAPGAARARVEERRRLVVHAASSEALRFGDDVLHRREVDGHRDAQLGGVLCDEIEQRIGAEDHGAAARRRCSGCVPASMAASSARRSSP
jgi:hypothetical protein